MSDSSTARRGFVQKTQSLGTPRNLNIDKALSAADSIEDEELVRKIGNCK